MSRDPIGERGDINIYRYVENYPGGLSDYLGMAPLGNSNASNIDNDVRVGTISGSVDDCCNPGASASIGIGLYMTRTGSLRMKYDELVREIGAKFSHLPEARRSCMRSALTEQFYKAQTEFGRKFTDAYNAGRIKRMLSPGKPNAYVSGLGKMTCNVGKCCIVAGVAIEAYTVISAPEGEHLKEAARAGGRMAGSLAGTWAGGWAGAKAGAVCGSCAGPWGVAAGGVVGGVAGGVVGACCGEYAVNLMIDGSNRGSYPRGECTRGCHNEGWPRYDLPTPDVGYTVP